MNKKIFPLFSFLLMFALAFASFAPAYAAASPGNAAGSYPPGYVPKVNLTVVYNPATNKITLTTAFAENIMIKRGDVSVSYVKPGLWKKSATLNNTKQITLSYVLPRGSSGMYCANVTLSGGSGGSSAQAPQFMGTASKCVDVTTRIGW